MSEDVPAPETGLTKNRYIAPRLVTGGQASLAAAEVLAAALDGLEDAGREVMHDAVDGAPLLLPERFPRAGKWGGGQGGAPGDLKDSARLEREDENRRVGILFDVEYASLQHEHMDWHHGQGHAKFLERAMNDNRDEILERVAARIREVTGGD